MSRRMAVNCIILINRNALVWQKKAELAAIRVEEAVREKPPVGQHGQESRVLSLPRELLDWEGMRARVRGGLLDSSSEVSDDSEPEVDETDDVAAASGRHRRDVRSFCFPSTSGCPAASEPPPNPAKRNPRPKWLPPGYRPTLYKGNPVYGFRMQLYCRTGYLLAIFPDQKVRGTDEDHPNALVEFSSVDFGEVRIKGLQSNLFLAMNKKGRLYGEADGKDDATVFVEYVYGQYNLYLSRKWAHLGWYVGIKKSGKMKPGHQTRYGQKAIQFLPRRKRHW